jgi:hypothetical protein
MQLPRKKAIIYNNDVHLIWMQYYTIKMFTSYDGNNIQLRCSLHMKAIKYNYVLASYEGNSIQLLCSHHIKAII